MQASPSPYGPWTPVVEAQAQLHRAVLVSGGPSFVEPGVIHGRDSGGPLQQPDVGRCLPLRGARLVSWL